MYEFKEDPVGYYSEVPQSNPIRWQLLHREGNVFTPQTKQFRCKDFLNDIVAKYNGTEVSVYGMNTNNMTLNPEGTWLRLFGIYNDKVFVTNINTCINKENPEHPISVEILSDSVLMFIPRYYYNQTYLISLATYLIRLSNRQRNFRSFESALSGVDAKSDSAINGKGIKLGLKWRYKVPEEYQKYWTFCTPSYNNLVNPYMGGTIHNNGVMSWSSTIAL